jgi:nicotinamidase-related amidase
MHLAADLYQQFDADPTRPAPAETFGGWKRVQVELAPAHTALVVMHAWDCGAAHEYPGWHRAVDYLPRAQRILHEVFPRLLGAVRASPLRVFHVGGGRDYYQHLEGYEQAARLAGPTPPLLQVQPDPVYERLRRLRAALGHPGSHNVADIERGFARMGFAAEAQPLRSEGVAGDGAQLAALCRAHGINHLIYVGFALNWCLLMSPGGMVDLARHGCLCSTIREAVTAVENRETANGEREKQQALWRVALEFGFVFGLDDFLSALPTSPA